MSLYHKYRPKTLDKMVGCEEAVAVLQKMIATKTIPHAILFSGNSGTGKTTMARILKSELNCSDMAFHEINSANNRGIDTIRDIQQSMQMYPPAGDCSIWLFDECFAAGTLVDTPQGPRRIESIRAGEVVSNIEEREVTVKHRFANRVGLDRLVKITLSTGRTIFTTRDHLFLTNYGWEKACFLGIGSYLMHNANTNMRLLQKGVSPTLQKPSKMLFQKLRREDATGKVGERSFGKKILFILQNTFCSTGIFFKTILQPILSNEIYDERSENTCSRTQPKNSKENERGENTISKYKRGESATAKIINSHENEQSINKTRSTKENEEYQREIGNTSYLERGTRGQRKIDYTTKDFVEGPIPKGSGLVDGSTDKDPQTVSVSTLLQSGYRPPQNENQYRSRWEGTRIESEYITRCQEGQSSERIGVVGVESFQFGDSYESFQGIITGRELIQGFVEFYDLEIEGHPSYFVEGVAVHNCHQQTRDSQNAMLKMLEDTPPYVYFFLCTTEPDRLIEAIRTRCTPIVAKALSYSQLDELYSRVERREGITLPDAVKDALLASAGGSARMLLVLLEKIAGLDEKQQIAAIEETKDAENKAIDLCRALIEKKSWKTVAGILVGLKETPPEEIRYAVLGYARQVLLKSATPPWQAYNVLVAFQSNFYDGKHAQLTAACYECVFAKE